MAGKCARAKMVKALEEIIEIAAADASVVSVDRLFVERRIWLSYQSRWRAQDDEIKQLFDTLNYIRKANYEHLLLTGGGEASTVALIFYGKTRLGFIEEQHLRKIEADKEVALNFDNTTLKIGFKDADEADFEEVEDDDTD